MKKELAVILVFAFALFGCCCAATGGRSPAQVVKDYNNQAYSCEFMRALTENCNLPADEYSLTAEQWQHYEETVRECKTTGYMPKITKFDVKSEQIQGDRAVVVVDMCLQDPTEPQPYCNTFTYRLEKVNGEWKIYGDDCGF